MTVVSTEIFHSKRLDDLDEIPPADLIKIDVQGAEKSIFENAGRQLDSVVSVISEVAFVPLYVGQPLYHHQAAVLEVSNFLLHKFMSMKAKCIGSDLMKGLNWKKHQSQNIDADAVFIKDLSDPTIYSDEQLVHLAICADAIFESFDLVLKCLVILIDRGSLSRDAAESYVNMVPEQKA